MNYSIETIEGIGATYGKTLKDAGISNTKGLLERCGTRAGRTKTAKETGLSEALLLKWTNMADLMRISGVGEEYSELLEAAGVDEAVFVLPPLGADVNLPRLNQLAESAGLV